MDGPLDAVRNFRWQVWILENSVDYSIIKKYPRYILYKGMVLRKVTQKLSILTRLFKKGRPCRALRYHPVYATNYGQPPKWFNDKFNFCFIETLCKSIFLITCDIFYIHCLKQIDFKII